MSLLSRIRAAINPPVPVAKAKTLLRARAAVINTGTPLVLNGGSMYPGTDTSGINDNFPGDGRSINAWLQSDLARIRARSRWLERASPWMGGFKAQALANILGAEGIYAALKVYNTEDEPHAGERDKYAERKIWAARTKFEQKKNFTTGKRLDAIDADKLIVTRTLFDGEIFIVRKPDFANECGFAWKIIDADYCDINLNRVAPNGNAIKMGIEVDSENAPVAYWFSNRRPTDYSWTPSGGFHHYRVPAEDVIHLYIQTGDPEQLRGIPIVFAAMLMLHREGRYEEAALLNAVQGAQRNIVYEKDFPEGTTAADIDDLADSDPGVLPDRFESGDSLEIPYGLRAKILESQYPSADFGPFIKAMLRGSSASLGMTYMSMTGDVSDANFSSLRAGKDDERQNWMMWQSFFIRNWKQPERKEWLYQALRRQLIPLPLARMEKYDVTTFVARRWASVNPKDDAATNQLRLDNREISIFQVIRETSQKDPEEVMYDIKAGEDLMKELGIGRVGKAGVPLDDPAKDEENEEGSSELDQETESAKQQADAYGVAVRAGVITPTDEDERYFREKMKLPPPNKNVASAWREDGGVRRPITLVQPGQAAAPGAPVDDPSAGSENDS